jgi:arylsulfatase A-like enzyme
MMLRTTTYVLLLADNGGVKELSNNAPLNDGKASTWEGGVRVPFMVAGPNIVGATWSDVPVSESDILPTVAEWLGSAPLPK